MRTKKRKAKRGFAAMSLEKLREIARKGGQSVNPSSRKTAHSPRTANWPRKLVERVGRNLPVNVAVVVW